jgi:hypothetical protein
MARVGSSGLGIARTRLLWGASPLRLAAGLLVLAVGPALLAAACSAANPAGSGGGGNGAGAGGGGAGGGLENPTGSGGAGVVEDPKTCADAAAARSYVGCDFWPTVVDNIVWGIFDYAVVVANAGDEPTDVTVTRNGDVAATATVAPNSLGTLYLPWVEELKSTSSIFACAPTSIKTSTVRAAGGAYHLTSTRPVTVYQFNAIEYAGTGGPAGKDWSACPGNACPGVGCFSYTNDASLLLPSTALTAAYRVTGVPSWTDEDFEFPPYIAVTGLSDGTSVTVKLSATGSVAGGAGVPSAGPGGTVTFSLDAGDVVELVAGPASDLSGSLVTATAPVQVIAGISCTNMPHDTEACDHVEESVFPAETLGRRYFVTRPTGPHGAAVGHVVRLYGNVDGTQLSYPGGSPGGPAVINAGEVVDLGVVTQDFEIAGDHELAVASFQVGAGMIDPNLPTDQQKGDPAQSLMTATEQFRTKYVFLAPTDYDASFVDVVQPLSATLTLDGAPVAATPTALSSGFGVARVELGPEGGGAHVLTASEPVGIQVVGYGTYTSYQYPGGLNLSTIAPVPLE